MDQYEYAAEHAKAALDRHYAEELSKKGKEKFKQAQDILKKSQSALTNLTPEKNSN